MLRLTVAVLLAIACAGSAGKDGSSANVSVLPEPPGAHCANGGYSITSSVGSATPSTSYACNGADGQNVTVTAEPAGANCRSGGAKVVAGSSTSYLCSGSDGASVTVTQEPAGDNCASGGLSVRVGAAERRATSAMAQAGRA